MTTTATTMTTMTTIPIPILIPDDEIDLIGKTGPLRLVWDECFPHYSKVKMEESPLIVYHYPGSLEQFSFRKDGRNRTVQYEKRFFAVNETKDDTSATQWLHRLTDLKLMLYWNCWRELDKSRPLNFLSNKTTQHTSLTN